MKFCIYRGFPGENLADNLFVASDGGTAMVEQLYLKLVNRGLLKGFLVSDHYIDTTVRLN